MNGKIRIIVSNESRCVYLLMVDFYCRNIAFLSRNWRVNHWFFWSWISSISIINSPASHIPWIMPFQWGENWNLICSLTHIVIFFHIIRNSYSSSVCLSLFSLSIQIWYLFFHCSKGIPFNIIRCFPTWILLYDS